MSKIVVKKPFSAAELTRAELNETINGLPGYQVHLRSRQEDEGNPLYQLKLNQRFRPEPRNFETKANSGHKASQS